MHITSVVQPRIICRHETRLKSTYKQQTKPRVHYMCEIGFRYRGTGSATSQWSATRLLRTLFAQAVLARAYALRFRGQCHYSRLINIVKNNR